MNGRTIYSNRRKYVYSLTVEDLSDGQYILTHNEWRNLPVPGRTARNIYFKRTDGTTTRVLYYLDIKGRLNIGSRVFNKATTKILLKWHKGGN